MKKFVLIIFFSVLCAFVSTAVFAGGVNINMNQSAEWGKTLARNSSLDVDAAFFNPGGTALMKDGLYLYLSNQTIYQPVDIKVRGGVANQLAGVSRSEYKGEKYAWYFPTAYLIYKKEKFAFSFMGSAIGGGGTGEFKNGLPEIDVLLSPAVGVGSILNGVYFQVLGANPVGRYVISSFKGSSAIYLGQVNFAYEIMKNFGISASYRFMYGDNTYDAKLYAPGNGFDMHGVALNPTYMGYLPLGSQFHARQSGIAHGVVVGLCYKPIDDLTIALKYAWNGPLRLKTTSKNDLIVGMVKSGFKNGGREHMQVAANLNIGITYKIQGLQIAAGYSYYFNQFAQLKQNEKNFVGGWDASIGLDYTIKKIPLNIGIGYAYSYCGARPSAVDQINDLTDSNNMSLGFTYKFNEMFQLTLAEVYSIYVPTNLNAGQRTNALQWFGIRYYKSSFITTIGLTAKVI